MSVTHGPWRFLSLAGADAAARSDRPAIPSFPENCTAPTASGALSSCLESGHACLRRHIHIRVQVRAAGHQHDDDANKATGQPVKTCHGDRSAIVMHAWYEPFIRQTQRHMIGKGASTLALRASGQAGSANGRSPKPGGQAGR